MKGGREGKKGRDRDTHKEETTIAPRKYCPVWLFLDDSLRWLITGIN